MGLTVEEALQLPALAGTSVAAGAAGLGRVVRHMVVDDPADLAGAGADVLVVLACGFSGRPRQLPCPGRAAGPDGHRALAFRRTEGSARCPARSSPRPIGGLPILALPPACDWTRSCPRCWAPSSTSRARPWRSPRAWTTSSSGWRCGRRARRGRPPAGRHARGRRRARPGARPRRRHLRRPTRGGRGDQRLAVAPRRSGRRRARRADPSRRVSESAPTRPW